jgi:hypothetical protein
VERRVAGAGQIGRRDGMSDQTNTSATVAVGHFNTGRDMECTATRSAYNGLFGFISLPEQTCAGGDVHVGENSTGTGQRNHITVTDDAAIQTDVIRGLSHRAAPLVREKFMSDCVNDFVKTQLFRKVKFISSVNMRTRALVIVMDALKILPPQRPAFVKMFESCVKMAINTKRSTCEQPGAKIVKELLIKKKTSQMINYLHLTSRVLRCCNNATKVLRNFWRPMCGYLVLSWNVFREREVGEN